MKKIHRVVALLLAALMAIGLMTTAFAVEPTIDPTKKASLNIYKYDITKASADGAWDAESYVSTGLHDDAVIDKLSKYAVQGVEFTYLRVADIAMNNEVVDGQRQVGVLYGFDGADAVLSAIGVTAADVHKSENGKNYYTSDLLNNKLSAALTANATTVKNNGSLTDIQKPSCDPPKISNHQGRDFRPPLVIVQQFAAIGAGLCRQADMTDLIQRGEINAFHIRFDLVIAERVTRLRNQADKRVLAVVQHDKLMAAGVNRHRFAARGGIRPFVVFMGGIQRKAVDAHAPLHPAVYGDGAEAFFFTACTPIVPVGEGAVVPYPIIGDALP